jgi:hypothetical protein
MLIEQIMQPNPVTVIPEQDALANVIRIVELTGTRISSVLTLTAADERREVVIRVATIDPRPAAAALAVNGYPSATPWRSVDHPSIRARLARRRRPRRGFSRDPVRADPSCGGRSEPSPSSSAVSARCTSSGHA